MNQERWSGVAVVQQKTVWKHYTGRESDCQVEACLFRGNILLTSELLVEILPRGKEVSGDQHDIINYGAISTLHVILMF
jgi:hypothetical protein